MDYQQFTDGRVDCDHATNDLTSISYTLNNKLHKIGEPAVVERDGKVLRWYIYGMEHNDNGPAIVSDKYKEWFRYGLHHRIGGPAIIAPEYIAWMENGLLHRDDGPAIIKRGEPPAKYINGVAVDSCDVRLVKNKGRWYAGDVLHHPE